MILDLVLKGYMPNSAMADNHVSTDLAFFYCWELLIIVCTL